VTDPSWIVHSYPGITVERLLIVADIVRVARDEAVDDHRPDKGEDPWALGVAQFVRQNFAVVAAQIEHPWLTVVHGQGGGPVAFVFAIAGHAIRACRGDDAEVPYRYQQPTLFEQDQQQMLIAIDPNIPTGVCLRLAVENDPMGRPLYVYLHEINETTGEPVRSYLIPKLEATTNVTPFTPPVEPPANLPPVSAEPSEAEQEKDEPKKTGSDDE